jgi:hypothetical protein
MASKKGIIVTIAILAGISVASFVVWFMPQNHGTTFVVTDYGNELDSVTQRHLLISSEITTDLDELSNKTLSADDFIVKAQTSSSQITSLITELIESNPPTDWKSSYLNYDEALKKYNDYLTETISLANKMKNNISPSDLNDEMSKIESIKKESDSFVTKSNETRP